MERQSLKEELKGMMLAGEFNSTTDEKLYFFIEETLKYVFYKIGALAQDRGEIINGVWLKIKEDRKMEEIAIKENEEGEKKINLLRSTIKYYALNYKKRVINRDSRFYGEEYNEFSSGVNIWGEIEEDRGEIFESIEKKLQLKKFKEKEKEQYYLIVQGYDNKEIAEKMNISYAACRKSKERLIKKLRAEYGVAV